jgi:hypothetical protein
MTGSNPDDGQQGIGPSPPQRQVNTAGSANQQTDEYEMITRPAAVYQSLSPTYAGLPKVYATIGAILPQPQSKAVFSTHEMPLDYESLSATARVPVGNKVYASLKPSS